MNTYSLLKDVFRLMYKPVRACSGCGKGIKYKGFTYYPRKKDLKDPPYEPSKLFLVRRTKTMSGMNPVERRCLAFLNIDGWEKVNAHINIVKNIPSVNATLWKVKHLVAIKPIRWKGELPKDFLGTHLRETGELVISPKLQVTPDQLQVTEEIDKNGKKLDRKYFSEYTHLKWWRGRSGAV